MATYYAVITNLGAIRLAAAQATATPLEFTHLAVGDGAGSPITPDAAMTALVNERARVAINNVEVDPDNLDTVRVEGLIPAATGGFTIHEAGLFNGDGELIAVASYPPIYKPVPADGASVEQYIRILFAYLSVTDAIALTVDTSVIIATRLYVDDQDDVVRAEFAAADAVIQAEVTGIEAGTLSLKAVTVDGVGAQAVVPTAGRISASENVVAAGNVSAGEAASGTSTPTPAFALATMYKESPPTAVARVSNPAGTAALARGMNIASVTRVSAGIVDLVLNTDGDDMPNAVIDVTANTTSARYGTGESVSGTPNKIRVRTFDSAGAAVDSSFFVKVWAW